MWLHLGGGGREKTTPTSPLSSACPTLGKGKSAHPHPTGLWASRPMGNCLDQPCQVPWIPCLTGLSSVGATDRSSEWGRSRGDSLEVIVWVWNEVLSPSCGLGQHNLQWETFDMSPRTPGSCRGHCWLHGYRTCNNPSRENYSWTLWQTLSALALE